MPNPFAQSKAFHKVNNVFAAALYRLLPTPGGFGLVTATGRKSGKPRARAMRVVRDGDRAYAVALLGRRADWLANVRADPNVTVKLGRTTHRAVVREVPPDDRARVAGVYRPVAGWYDYFDYVTYVWGVPTRANVLRTHDAWLADGVPVVFELAAP